MADFIAGDTGSVLRVPCIDRQTKAVIDLNGKTAALKYRNGGATSTKSMTSTDQDKLDGVASYQFGATDLVAGGFEGQVKITDGAGKVITQLDKIVLNVGTSL